jgi:hypothetical protein
MNRCPAIAAIDRRVRADATLTLDGFFGWPLRLSA